MTFHTRDKIDRVPELIVTVAVSRTGKSTWANNYVNPSKWVKADRSEVKHAGGPVVIASRDDIRRAMGVEYDPRLESAVRMVSDYMIRAALTRAQDVVVDELNLKSSSRSRWVQLAKEMGANLVWVVFEIPPKSELIERARASSFPVPVLLTQLADLEEITPEEENAAYKVIRVFRDGSAAERYVKDV